MKIGRLSVEAPKQPANCVLQSSPQFFYGNVYEEVLYMVVGFSFVGLL